MDERDRHEHRAEARRGAQEAEADLAGVEDVAGEDRQQRGRPAGEDREQIERHRAEEDGLGEDTGLLARFLTSDGPSPAIASTAGNDHPPELGIRLFALGGRKSPAYIDRVLPNSPAAAAGLRGDDLIISIGGQVVHHSADYRRIAALLRPGQEVAVEIKRGDQLLTVRITPGESP